jgi:hypothetical protein
MSSSHGSRLKSIIVILTAAVCILLPASTQAAQKITQLEFVQWLVQVTGDSSSFSDASGETAFIDWAKSKGINPRGGWQPSAVLTKDALAESLVQLFNLNPKRFGGNLEKNLLREGIILPDASLITRLDLMGVVDDFGFQSRTDILVAQNTGSPVKRGRANGGIPPGFLNPKNPHFGLPEDQLPGAQGIENARSRGNKR